MRFLPLALVATASIVGSARRRYGPPRFDVREGVGFAVPASRTFGNFVAGGVLLVGLIVADAFRHKATPVGMDGVFVAVRDVMTIAMLTLTVPLAGLAISAVVIALRGRPRVELTPQAVRAQGMLGSRTVPWGPP